MSEKFKALVVNQNGEDVDKWRWGTHTSNMSETRGRLKTIARRRRVKNTGVGNLTPLINEV